MPWFVWDCPSFSTESSTESLVSGETAQFQGRWTPYLEGRTLPEAQLQSPDWGRVWVQKLLRGQQHFPTRTGDKDSHDSHPNPTHRCIYTETPTVSKTGHSPHTQKQTPTGTRYTHSDSRRQLRLTDPRSQKRGCVDTIGTHSPLTTHAGNTNTYAQNHTVVKTGSAERHSFHESSDTHRRTPTNRDRQTHLLTPTPTQAHKEAFTSTR